MFKSCPLCSSVIYANMAYDITSILMHMSNQDNFHSHLQVPYMGLAAIITGTKMRLVFSDEHTVDLNGYSED